ncbi:Sec-independent protein translocase protein TatB [Sphingomonas carotinifaciens]|uniref:Sec-independent protein translocase protein TatB n=1 Tax=Sphingomonas carotinifaciens TaxID=1166323 RepID=UPI0039A0D9B0
MFDIAPTEFMLVAFVALVVIGPKDLPKAMRVVGYWVGKARGVARQFRQGFDTMVREAELEEMEKRWAAENERIMREHPPAPPAALDDEAAPAPVSLDKPSDHHGATDPVHDDTSDRPVTVEKPHIVPAAPGTPAHTPDGAPS